MMPDRLFTESAAVACAQRMKAQRRAFYRRQRETFYQRHAVWVVHKMGLARHEIEWRVLVLTAPDTRSLTARLLGDPIYERSMLFFKRMQVA